MITVQNQVNNLNYLKWIYKNLITYPEILITLLKCLCEPIGRRDLPLNKLSQPYGDCYFAFWRTLACKDPIFSRRF